MRQRFEAESVRVSLASWLLTQIDAEEAAANAATPGPWRYNPNKHWHQPGTCNFEESVFAGESGKQAVSVAGTGPSDEPEAMATAAHIARWDPARVLAECAARRKIIHAHHDPAVFPPDDEWAGRPMGDCPDCRQSQPCNTLRLLALPYASEPGYRAEWAI